VLVRALSPIVTIPRNKMKTEATAITRRRMTTYCVVALGLLCVAVVMNGVEWRSSAQIHTLMEVVATQLAMGVGVVALLRYYTRKDNTFLLIGAGFLGTAFLDGYHAVVTSDVFRPLMPSDLPSLIPWSWSASRLFLSLVMLLSWAAWCREQRLGSAGRFRDRTVYAGIAVFTLASGLFFTFAPLPAAYFPALFFSRPEEFVAATFFLLALGGYLRKGCWRVDQFEHWVVLSLVVGFMGQAAFMSHSGVLFDYDFDVAHLLKKASYICVLAGLLVSVYATFRKADESGQRLGAFVDNTIDGIATIDHRGVIETVNPAISTLFGYQPEELIGQNVSIFLPENERHEHQNYIDHSDLHVARVIDLSRDLKGQRKDGTQFPIELTISAMEYDGKAKFAGIVRDITDRKRAERMKNEFVATVSHELRTPLTSIKGALGLVKAGAAGGVTPDIKSMIDIAFKNSERLVHLINDILDIEKMEAGKMEFQMENQDLSALVSSSILANSTYAEQFGVTLELVDVVPPYRILGDADRLQQVLANLLSNAIKFSPEGGRVKVSVSRIEMGFSVAVHDDGIGIPASHHAQVFEKFSQVDASDSRQKGGTGLGLHIAKSIVETHHGKIYFESEAGVGTTFHVDLPGAWPDTALKDPAEERQDLKILVCEPEREVGALLAYILRTGGYSPIVANDLGDARELISKQSFSAFVLDMDLPDQEGASIIQEIRGASGGCDLPVIAISASPDEQQKKVNGAGGFVDWLVKPVARQRLYRSLSAAIQSAADEPQTKPDNGSANTTLGS
jgi:PAS domain S-box-containing protein